MNRENQKREGAHSDAKRLVSCSEAVWLALVAVLVACSGCSPPALRDCTHIEIQYGRPALVYFFRGRRLREVLDSAETEYLHLHNTFVVRDQEAIKVFARSVSLGSYDGLMGAWSTLSYAYPVYVRCYRGDRRLASFTVYGNLVVMDDRRKFKYPAGQPDLMTIEPMEIRPFRMRRDCARGLEALYNLGPLYRDKVRSCPDPAGWCDAIMDWWRTVEKRPSDYLIAKAFARPSVFIWPSEPNSPVERRLLSSYAMNPDCEPNSPPDTVLLFETELGWNQHGGPELFTWDNHEPRGGCILLNDGTLKFIRNRDELYSLRWK